MLHSPILSSWGVLDWECEGGEEWECEGGEEWECEGGEEWGWRVEGGG